MVSLSNVRLYYKNVTAGVIGKEHGITSEQFSTLARNTVPAIEAVNSARQAGQTPYRDLPYNQEYPSSVKAVAASIEGQCDNFVVLGIGGSALGNIAVQTALNPYMYNMDQAQRKGPRLFVFDNVDIFFMRCFLFPAVIQFSAGQARQQNRRTQNTKPVAHTGLR